MTATMTTGGIRERLQAAADQPGPAVTAIKVDHVRDQILLEAVETAQQLAHADGHGSDWSAADRSSSGFYDATSVLIGETIRRYVAGAVQDGRDPAEAVHAMARSLHTAVFLTEYELAGGTCD